MTRALGLFLFASLLPAATVPYVNSAITGTQSGAVTLAGITAGDFLVIATHSANSGGTGTLHTSLNPVGNYTHLISGWNYDPAGSDYLDVWVLANSAAGSETISCTGGGVSLQIIIGEYNQIPLSSPVDGTPGMVTSGSASVMTTKANDLLVFFVTTTAMVNTNPTQGGGYNTRVAFSSTYGGTQRGLGLFDQLAGAAGSYSNNSTSAGTGVAGAALIGIFSTIVSNVSNVSVIVVGP